MPLGVEAYQWAKRISPELTETLEEKAKLRKWLFEIVREEMPDRFKAEVFRYFGDEVFAAQPDSIQDFLVKTSILESVDSGLARDFIGIENTEEILKRKAKYENFKLLTDIQKVLQNCTHLTSKEKALYCQSQRYFMKLYLREINKPD